MNSTSQLPFRKVALGTTNKAKLNAVKAVLPSIEIIAKKISSDVSPQPFSDHETLQGAKNRAKNILLEVPEAEIGIGLEGGVTITEDGFFLCNWGALTDGKNMFIAGGARIPLPLSFLEPLQHGKELGELIDVYAAKKDVRNHEGAMGILTDGWLKRNEIFVQIMQMLVGQYLHSLHS